MLNGTAALGTYYIGVQSEDQEAVEYNFLGVFSDLPFDQNLDGSHLLRGFPVPAAIPDGTPKRPGGTYIFGIATTPVTVNRVVVSNTISHQLVGDLVGTFTHNRTFAVLNNHTPDGPVTNKMYIYDDSGRNDIPGAMRTDGPGSLKNFAAQQGVGQWMLTMSDNALGHVGTNENLSIFVEKQPDLNDWITNAIQPHSCLEEYIDIPVGASNLTVQSILLSNPCNATVTMTVCPLDGGGCQSMTLTNDPNVTNTITIDENSNPPLSPGEYSINLCNQGDCAVLTALRALVTLGPPPIPTRIVGGPVAIVDDAVTTSTITVTNTTPVVSLEVGLRVDHPRISDLVFHLISPMGTRTLLCENRGANDPNGMGTSLITTEIAPSTSNGGATPQTNSIDTGETSGTITIDYNMYEIQDQMVVYAGSTLLIDTGFVSGTGTLTLNYTGSRVITIIMNPNGNPEPGTAWYYTVTSTRAKYLYFTFTEDTNKTVMPVKFAPPPFTATSNSVTTVVSDFETNAQGTYTVGTNVDGWTVQANPVQVVAGGYPGPGGQALNLESGQIVRQLPTLLGHNYQVSFMYSGGQVQVVEGGQKISTVPATNGWMTNSVTFEALAANTPFEVDSLTPGTLVDYFTLTDIGSPYFVLPEETLDKLKGEAPAGQWTLEVWDNRAGPAGTTNGTLVSWELSFVNQTPASAGPTPLQHGVTVSNTVCSGGWQYYSVDVPTWTDFVENRIIQADGAGVSLWFNQYELPDGTKPGDRLLVGPNALSGVATLYTNFPPYLLPGQTYYLGVRARTRRNAWIIRSRWIST